MISCFLRLLWYNFMISLCFLKLLWNLWFPQVFSGYFDTTLWFPQVFTGYFDTTLLWFPQVFSGYFDTTTGSKTDSASYKKIATEIGSEPKDILYLTHVPQGKLLIHLWLRLYFSFIFRWVKSSSCFLRTPGIILWVIKAYNIWQGTWW